MRKLDVTCIGDGHYEVDMRGWVCPYPKYAVEALVGKLEMGQRLDLLVDCPSATVDVPKVAKAAGCEILGVRQIGSGEWSVSINK